MATFTSLTQLRLHQRARFQRVGTEIKTVHKELATEGRKDFGDLTGGTIKSKQLAAMGHPFGRRAGGGTATGGRGIIRTGAKNFRGVGKAGQISKKGFVRGLPINVQSGKLRRGIRFDGPLGPNMVYRLYSNAPYAKYVLNPTGTSKMIARGLLGGGEIVKRHRARKAAFVDVVRAAQKRP